VEAFILSDGRGTPGATVFSSPHSGAHYPEAFLQGSQLDPLTLRSSEDAFVDTLFASAPDYGAPLLAARFPRAYVDLNRARTELDPAIVDIPRHPSVNPRISAGLGVIPRVVSGGRVIRSGRMTREEADLRLAQVHTPYHNALNRLLQTARIRHGHAILIDCHSMPHEALRVQNLPGGRRRPEIVLGDRFGTSCAPWISDLAYDAFTVAGFTVARNAPFAGGYITETYGLPAQNMHALQIEIDRSLYMDEARIAPRSDFAAFRDRLTPVIAALAQADGMGQALAAE